MLNILQIKTKVLLLLFLINSITNNVSAQCVEQSLAVNYGGFSGGCCYGQSLISCESGIVTSVGFQSYSNAGIITKISIFRHASLYTNLIWETSGSWPIINGWTYINLSNGVGMPYNLNQNETFIIGITKTGPGAFSCSENQYPNGSCFTSSGNPYGNWDFVFKVGFNGAVIDPSVANVGVGTSTPTHKLHIVDIQDPIKLVGLQSGWSTDSILTINTTTNLVKRRNLTSITGTLDDTKDYWSNTGNNSIFNQASGLVGVGTPTPSHKLHVSDTSDPLKLEGLQTGASTDSILTFNTTTNLVKRRNLTAITGVLDDTKDYWSNTGNNSIFNQASGLVGVGTPTPSHKLHVSDTSDPLKLEGLQTGASTDSILTFNTTTNLVKRRNLTAITGALDDTKDFWSNSGNNSIFNQASGNVIIGATSEGTVASATSGSTTAQQLAKHTIVGGDGIINGITLGKGGGQVNTNTALGNQALYDNLTTGINNTAVGNLALTNNTSGDFNTAFGHATLLTNTTSSNNTAVGYAALNANTGSTNNAFGANALIANTLGTQNVAIGTSSLFENIDGDFNVAVGNNALQNSANNHNIGIGYQAGDNLTTGSNNISIGTASDVPSPTASNQLSIGNLIYGTGVTGSAGAGNIGIGAPAPSEKLQISGGIKISDGGYTGLTNNATSPVPAGGAGTIVFSNGHFFGWTGSAWKQLDN